MEKSNEEIIAIIMGILSIIVVIYRIISIGLPMFLIGIEEKNISTIFKSMTTLV